MILGMGAAREPEIRNAIGDFSAQLWLWIPDSRGGSATWRWPVGAFRMKYGESTKCPNKFAAW
jgi:hypothetical protein